jgi:uncharacterized protein (DUF2062 family)
MNPRRWLHEHSLKLLAIRDTPQAIAGGVAIGIFFGFTPLFGIKTLSAIFFAWLTRCNILAAALGATLHDVMFPFMPFVFTGEYSVGFWLINHHWPAPGRVHLPHSWQELFSAGKPLLLGSVVLAAPFAIAAFPITKMIVTRHQRRKQAQQEAPGPSPRSNPEA